MAPLQPTGNSQWRQWTNSVVEEKGLKVIFSFTILVVYARSCMVLACCRAQSSVVAEGTAPAVSKASSLLMVDVAFQVSSCQDCLMPFHGVGVDNHSFSDGVLLLMSCVIRWRNYQRKWTDCAVFERMSKGLIGYFWGATVWGVSNLRFNGDAGGFGTLSSS